MWSTDRETGTHINEKEYRTKPEENPHNMPNWLLKKVQKQFNEEKITFSTNGAGTIGYP